MSRTILDGTPPKRPEASAVAARNAGCRHCVVRRVGACAAIPGDDALAILKGLRTLRIHDCGETIYHQGDPAETVYSLCSGWVAQQQDLSNGRRGATRFILPGDVFGVEPDGSSMGHSAVAVTAVSVCAIPRLRHNDLRQAHPTLNEAFLWEIERDNHLMLEALSHFTQDSAAKRLAHLFWSLALRRLGRRPRQAGEAIWLPLSQLHLADAAGLSAVHVSRTLTRLRADGVIDFHERWLTIRDTARLEALAEPGEDIAASHTPVP